MSQRNLGTVNNQLEVGSNGNVGDVLTRLSATEVGWQAGGGIAGVALENAGVPLAGGPFTTLDALGGTFANEGGGIASYTPPAAVSTIQAAAVTLTDAQIKALPTTSFVLVAAPGANRMLVPLMIALDVDSSGGAYTNINANASMQVSWNGSLQATARALETTLGQVSALLAPGGGAGKGRAVLAPEIILFAATLYANNPGGAASFDNVPLSLVLGNGGSGNLTGGNAANSARVVVLYYVMTVLS